MATQPAPFMRKDREAREAALPPVTQLTTLTPGLTHSATGLFPLGWESWGQELSGTSCVLLSLSFGNRVLFFFLLLLVTFYLAKAFYQVLYTYCLP